MAAPKKAIETEKRRLVVAELYLKQLNQFEIAARLPELGFSKVTRQTVSYDLQVIQQRWRESSVFNMDEAKQRELERIDTLEREYWRQYEASQEEFIRTMTEKSTANDATKARVIKETRLGDPRYLAGVQWCIEQRCKILGIEAPKKTDLTSGGKPFQVIIKHADDSDPDYN